MSNARRSLCLIAMLAFLLTGAAAMAQAAPAANPALPDRYRDFKIYTSSAADEKDPAKIKATVRMINEGGRPLAVIVRLDPQPKAGFAGREFRGLVKPKDEITWPWEFTPPDGMRREIITGGVWFNSDHSNVHTGGGIPSTATRDRDLFLAVQGADPADFDDQRVEKITERARVVATYAPRTREAVRASFQAAEAARRARPRLTIARDGQSDYRIVLGLLPAGGGEGAFEPWAADPARTAPEKGLIDAVQDLRRVIQVQSGAELPVVAPARADNAPKILITLPDRGEGLLMPHPDAYNLLVEGRDLIIKAAGPDGLRHGIYGLLTDHLDAHWFQPRKLGEEIVVPADRTVSVRADLGELQSPSWFSVTGMSWSNSPRWDRQNRAVINRGRMSFGHAWQSYLVKADFPYEEFPDMWARDREGNVRIKDEGWTYTNFCSTSPEVIRLVADKINAQFDADPNAIVASLDPNDYAPMCLCDRCLAVDKLYGQTKEDGTEVADRLIHFSNQIHSLLKPEHRSKYLGFLAYGFQMELPISAKAHDHQAVLICNFPTRYDATRPFNDPTSEKARDFHRLVKGWGERVGQLGYYDYPGHWYYFGPWGMIHKLREEFPAFHELGGTFLIIEAQPNFGIQGVNLYVAARLAWDKDADVDVLLEEFFVKYYGPAADAMREFWLANERRFALTRPGTHAERAAEEPEFWAELDSYLKQAEAKVAGLGGAQQRFKDRVLLHREGFDFGRSRWEFATRYAPRRGPARDVVGAIAHLRAAKPRLEALQNKYGAADEYWPTLLPAYFYPDVDAMIARLEKDGQLRPE